MSNLSRHSAGGSPLTRREFARLTLLSGSSAIAACSPHTGPKPDPPAVGIEASATRPAPAGTKGGFPRTAVSYLSQENLPTPEQFARYDLIVIDSEWVHRVGGGFFAELKAHNPDAKVLAYVNLVDYSTGLGDRADWANRYSLWQYESPTASVFPREWLATTAEGQIVSEWPHTLMTNLTDATVPVNGQTYAQYAANWVVNHVWSAGVWDGIYLDVWGDRVWSADHDSWDYRLVGTNTPDSEIYGLGKPWERGINDAEVIMRSRMPNAIIIGNGTRTMRDRQLNGRVWEHFLDSSSGSDREGDLTTYMNESSDPNIRQRSYPLTINVQREQPGSAQEYQRARYFLTATLLQDGYWAPMVDSDYGALNYYDELDGAGLGRGYLGMPTIAGPDFDRLTAPYRGGLGTVAPDVYRRDFDNGAVLHNAGPTVQTIKLDEPMRLLTGRQDPSINTGEVVETITLDRRDGRVLVRR